MCALRLEKKLLLNSFNLDSLNSALKRVISRVKNLEIFKELKLGIIYLFIL